MLRKGLTRGCAAFAIASFLLTGKLCPAQTAGANTPSQPVSSVELQKDPDCFGKVVNKIVFTGVADSDQKMLRDMLPLHEGEVLNRSQLQNSLRILFGTGRFADLQAECEPSPEGGSDISFASSPNFFVGRVSVEGGPGKPTDSQIVNASKLQLGELYTSDHLVRALTNIRRLLEENGFYRSTITHSEQQNAAIQQVEVTFHIHSGDAARVGNVTVLGNGLYSRGQIEDIAHLHPTDIVSAQKASTAIEKIRKKYQKQNRWLAQVSIAEKKYVPQTNTVDYTFEIEPGPLVQIRVEGFRLSNGTIKRSVPVYEEGALDDDLLNEGQRNLLNHMQSRGYFDATVDLRQESDPQKKELRVIYQIEAGEKHKIGNVEITGNKYFRTEDLRTAMQVQAASVLLLHGRYSQALLRSDVRNLEDKYRTNGFLQVKVEGAAADLHRGRKNQIGVMIHITEGPQTLVGTFQINGNSTNIAEDPFPVLNTSPGQPFAESLIAEDRDHLLNYYFNNGFPNATFEVTAKPGADHRMDVVFNIHEGERFYVDHVLLSGREFTKPHVIDHELQVRAGDDLSQIDLLDTQKKLYDLGIFSQVDTAVQNPEGTETRKNVLVQVQEAKRYTFNYGLGFEFQTGQPGTSSSQQPLGTSGVSPLASLDVTRLNFLGRAHTITFESRVGRLQQRGLISYQAPRWLNNPDLNLAFTGFFDHTLDVSTFTSQRLEGAVQVGQVLTKTLNGEPINTIDYRFNYRLVKATNVQIDPNLVPLLSLPVRVGEPGFGYIRDRRDNKLETTRGTYIAVDAGVAGHYFGSQADFSRVMVQNSTYHPLGKQQKRQLILARSTRVGVENPFGDTIITQPGELTMGNPTLIPLPERFFMGGGNSHRGFGLNQAGPRDPLTGFPLGGSALFLNNFELRFPPPTLPWVQDNLSFAIFHDMGNVFTNGNHMLDSLLHWHQNTNQCLQTVGTQLVTGSGATLCRYDYLSHAIGLGIRYKTPVGPVRFDLGYNLNPTVYPGSLLVTPATSTTPAVYNFTGTKQASPFNVYFSIGQSF